jgi:hypothetical protein
VHATCVKRAGAGACWAAHRPSPAPGPSALSLTTTAAAAPPPAQAPLNIECLLDDKDVRSTMTRDKLEELVGPLFPRVQSAMERVSGRAAAAAAGAPAGQAPCASAQPLPGTCCPHTACPHTACPHHLPTHRLPTHHPPTPPCPPPAHAPPAPPPPPCAQALEESGLSLADISSVEMVGSSTRVPVLAKMIEDFFGRPPSRTMHSKECVARGACLQCAMLSPVFKVRGGGGGRGVAGMRALAADGMACPAASFLTAHLHTPPRTSAHLRAPPRTSAHLRAPTHPRTHAPMHPHTSTHPHTPTSPQTPAGARL